ncbi:MATE family efflux transporter [Paeniroseomonas aquatica]|uniref:MATE family efflux transporter n=1 Tax=Paeniroseomonas aquatica TaxID=373043 RepID=UPI003618059B
MPSISKEWVAEARTLAGISASVTITMLAQLAISAVEILIVARLGIHELAGVALALSIDLLVFLATLGVVTAVTPLAAAARGRGDFERLRRYGQGGLLVGLAVSVPGVLVLLGCRSILVAAMGPGIEADSASAYLAGAAGGLPAWVLYVAVRSLAVATGQVRVTTAVMLAVIPIHAALAPWLVFGGFFLPPLGALGAGLAYAATGHAALMLLAIAIRLCPAGALGASLRSPFVFDRTCCREIVQLGVPFACRIVLREGLLPAAAFVLVPFGAAAVAAHVVATRIVDLCGVFTFGFSDAANARVGHAVGSGNPAHAARSAWVAVQLSTVVGLGAAAMLVLAPTAIVRAVLGDLDPADIEAAAALLPIAACLLVLESVQSAAGGALSGLRDAKGPLLIAILGGWGFGPLGLVLAWLGPDPAAGIWCGLVGGACLTVGLYLHRLRSRLGDCVRTQHAAARPRHEQVVQ